MIYEYFLAENNYIKGWQIHPDHASDKIQYSSNPKPIKEMNVTLYDENKKLKYQLVNNEIIENIQILTPEEQEEKEKKIKREIIRNSLPEVFRQLADDEITINDLKQTINSYLIT
jgi:DNA recombination-dependent growth factor C